MRHTSTAFNRRRTDSVRSNTGSITPADELTSWLGDDVCTTCGSGVRAGQLYCSQECRDEDTTTQLLTNSNKQSSSSAPTKSASSNQLHRSSHHRQSSKVSAWAKAQHDSSDSDSGKFRYACPPSPHVLAAKHGSHLTSPALAAHDRQPVAAAARQSGTEGEWVSSSERRSSSRSTYSSTSDALSTDPSTPSPLLTRPTNDDLDELDGSEFNLPPSVIPSTLNIKEAKQALSGRSPAQRLAGLPATNVPARNTMSFARRPSRTNVPPPVLFTSPVLATTMMRASTGTRRESNGANAGQSSPSSPKSTEAQKLASSWQQAKQQLHDAHLARNKRASVTTAAALPVGLRTANAQLLRKAPASPPLPNSASSSAGRTLRAVSPPSAAISLSSDKASLGVCGRFGCQGFSGSAGPRSQENGSQPSLSLHSHKHTHSANAGLNLLGREDRVDDATSVSTSTPKHEIERIATPTTDSVTESTSVRSPPRGRSKARGRSSTSRRSPSPPRGAARRGRSEDIRSLGGALSGLAMATQRPVVKTTFTAETQDDADDEDDERTSRRGRSPTERAGLAAHRNGGTNVVNRSSRLTARHAIPTGMTATRVSASGYDDVDLDEL